MLSLKSKYPPASMRNARPDDSKAGIKTVWGRNINNLRYANDTLLMAEREEELKSVLIKVKEKSEKASLKLNIRKMKIMASSPIPSWPIEGKRIEVSPSALVLPINIQDWFPLGLSGWISLQSKRLSRVFSNTTLQKHQFFRAQPSSQSNSHIHTWPQEKPEPWLDRPLLAK